MDLTNLKQTINFALDKEHEAIDFYTKCSNFTTRSGMKDAFVEMAEEEKKHVRMLENFKPEQVEKMQLKNIPDLKISDYLVDMEFNPEMSYQDLLILAMKREEASIKLYTEFTQKNSDPALIKLFQILAQEELRHKNRLQKEYDDVILKDN
ncbi:MAG: ferritin family protein [bacterium]